MAIASWHSLATVLLPFDPVMANVNVRAEVRLHASSSSLMTGIPRPLIEVIQSESPAIPGLTMHTEKLSPDGPSLPRLTVAPLASRIAASARNRSVSLASMAVTCVPSPSSSSQAA